MTLAMSVAMRPDRNRAVKQRAHREQHHEDVTIELWCALVVDPHGGDEALDERLETRL